MARSRMHLDERVADTIHPSFKKFRELGSGRQVFLWGAAVEDPASGRPAQRGELQDRVEAGGRSRRSCRSRKARSMPAPTPLAGEVIEPTWSMAAGARAMVIAEALKGMGRFAERQSPRVGHHLGGVQGKPAHDPGERPHAKAGLPKSSARWTRPSDWAGPSRALRPHDARPRRHALRPCPSSSVPRGRRPCRRRALHRHRGFVSTVP